MAGHDLLSGCQQPWNHDDCPGSVDRFTGETPYAVVCHCPCHGLKQELKTLLKELSDREFDVAEKNLHLGPWMVE